MKAKRNKRTLKKRMRKAIILSTIITTLIFSGTLFYLASGILEMAANFASDYLGSRVALEMNSPDFLKKYNIKSLKDFGPSVPGYNNWVMSVNSTVNSNPLAPMNRKPKKRPEMSISINNNVTYLSTLAYVTVTINKNQIYTNMPKDSAFSSIAFLNNIYNRYSTPSTTELTDENAQFIGTVTSRINPALIIGVFFSIIILIILAFILAYIFAILFSNFAVYPVLKPIVQLDKKIQLIAEEDFETTLDTKIILKKPPREIESIANTTNRVMEKLQNYNEQTKQQNQILENQNTELESQNIELVESRQKIEEAQEKLYKREKSVRTLLDNAGQGFLSFGRDFLVDKEYSVECENIFGSEMYNKYLPDLILHSDEEQKTFFVNVIKKIFLEDDTLRRHIYLPLLPEEISINDKTIHIDYKLIGDVDEDYDDDIMMILTDITHNKYLENQIEQERNILKMVVKTVVNYSDFVNNLNDYYNFCSYGIDEIFSLHTSLDDLTYSIFREIHTFKGNFSQMCLVKVVDKLHNIESAISDIRKELDTSTVGEFRNYLNDCKLDKLVDEDLDILKEILGDNFFKKDEVIVVDCQKLIELEKKMLEILTPVECKALLPDLRKLRYKTFREFLSTYEDYIQRLASNLGKMVDPLEIKGSNFQIDSNKYKNFIKSLVHVFRNIMDHAIETPEERIECGKNETGNIVCSANITGGNKLYLSIADDGRGIDIAKIKAKAVEKGLYSEEEVNNLPDSKVLNLIFEDGFSTRDDVTQLSGRGLGLSVVKNEVDKLYGSVDVKTEAGVGTEFQFILPYETLNETPEITISRIIKPLVNRTRNLIIDEASCILNESENFLIKQVEKIQLLEYTVFVSIKGIISGKVLISVDEALARLITRKFVLQDVTTEEETELIEDALAECANVIVGNSFKLIPELEDLTIMETPITINSEFASFNCPASRMWTVEIRLGPGKMKLGFTSLDDIDE